MNDPTSFNFLSFLPSNLTSSKLLATTAACTTAAFITYPAEMYKISFINSKLANWNYDYISTREVQMEQTIKETSLSSSEHSVSDKFIRGEIRQEMKTIFSKYGILKQKLRVFLTPLIRLTTHEMSLALITNIGESNFLDQNSYPGLDRECVAGMLAGTCQAVLLCPLEVHRANRIMEEELKSRQFHPLKNFVSSIKENLAWNGSSEPEERRKRALFGVKILAMREMVFNVSFFPIFYSFQKLFQDEYKWELVQSTFCKGLHVEYDETLRRKTTVASGILAGMLCSLAVTPIDIYKTYMLYSREEYSFWSGKHISAPPPQLLLRGLGIQALIFGPTFGIVAAIYELA